MNPFTNQMCIRDRVWADEYAALQDIPMIDTVMLRTPMILHPKSSKRTGMFLSLIHI